MPPAFPFYRLRISGPRRQNCADIVQRRGDERLCCARCCSRYEGDVVRVDRVRRKVLQASFGNGICCEERESNDGVCEERGKRFSKEEGPLIPRYISFYADKLCY